MSQKPRTLALTKDHYCLTNMNPHLRYGKQIPLFEVTSQDVCISFSVNDTGSLFITNYGHGPVLRLVSNLTNESQLSLHNFENKLDLPLAPNKQITLFVPHIPFGILTPVLLSITIENYPDQTLIKITNPLPAVP